MRPLPLPDPGIPDLRSPGRFLIWIAARQWRTLAWGIALGIVWMVAQALVPYAIGQGIERGVADGDFTQVARWAAVVLALAAVQAVAGVLRHRVAVANWLTAAFRVNQLMSRHTARTGPALPRQVTTGEVVATVASDAPQIGNVFDITARFAGSLVAYVVVAVVLLASSVPLGLLVLIGVPLLTLCLTPVLRPLQSRQRDQRAALGRLTALGADTVSGLRVLRGIGGESVFFGRYRERSEEVRVAGVRVAGTQATLDAAQVLLPGIFLVLVTWLGARFALAGDISTGDLVAFYGYAFFLVIPLRNTTEAIDKFTRGHVAAKRVVDVLGVGRDVRDPQAPAPEPAPSRELVDARSGLVVRPGLLTALVSAEPAETAQIADRLGRFVDDPGVSLGGVRLVDLPVETVRRRVLVSETEPRLFTGTLATELNPAGQASRTQVLDAVHTAAAEDVLDALADGLDAEVEERGRSFSGGQRQRLVLTRALLADPDVLVLVEPTSAVDAHTEARIADRLRDARDGRTTVVTTSSPLVLDRTDHVAWVRDGRVVAEGTHHDLLRDEPSYRDAVTRGEDT